MSDLNIDEILEANSDYLNMLANNKEDSREKNIVKVNINEDIDKVLKDEALLLRSQIMSSIEETTIPKEIVLEEENLLGEETITPIDLKESKKNITSNFVNDFLKGEVLSSIENSSIKKEESSKENLEEMNKEIYKEAIDFKQKLLNKVTKPIDPRKEKPENIDFDEFFGGKKNQMSDESIKLIESVFGWFYDTLDMLSSVYTSYSQVFENIESFKTFSPKKMASSINVEKFLYNYRKVDTIVGKLNLIATSLGNYNFHLICDKYKNSFDFTTLPKDKLLSEISMNYNGNAFDLSYLREFNEVVKADLSGEYIFEDLVEKEPSPQEEKPIQKEKSSKKSIFSPFKLKK